MYNTKKVQADIQVYLKHALQSLFELFVPVWVIKSEKLLWERVPEKNSTSHL